MRKALRPAALHVCGDGRLVAASSARWRSDSGGIRNAAGQRNGQCQTRDQSALF